MEWLVAAALVGWLLSTLGWLISSRHANNREARKEYRAAVSALEDDVDDLLAAYLAYLTEPKATENEQARLRVHSVINRLRRHVLDLTPDVGPELREGFTELFEVITGGQFESRTRKPERAAEDYARAVACAETLLDAAESWFRTKYLAPDLSECVVRV